LFFYFIRVEIGPFFMAKPMEMINFNHGNPNLKIENMEKGPVDDEYVVGEVVRVAYGGCSNYIGTYL
jgi:hypothetical protein